MVTRELLSWVNRLLNSSGHPEEALLLAMQGSESLETPALRPTCKVS